MQKSIPVLFKRSLLAVAIISMSACSTTPSVPSPHDSGLTKVGKATANAGRKTWNTTAYYLGFRDSRGTSKQKASDDNLLASGNTLEIAPLDENSASEDRPLAIKHSADGSHNNGTGGQDLIHVVAQNETLWDIAKKTTGDANNWHALADVNNLQQNAAVFPNQKLLIPGDMVKPDYNPDAAAIAIVADVDNTDSSEGFTDIENSSATDVQTVSNDTESDTLIADELASGQDAIAIELQDNETLWDFAKRTTGDATNWKQIASQNNFTEKQATSVRPGQSIEVPNALLRDSDETIASVEPAELVEEPAEIVIQAEEQAVDVASAADTAESSLVSSTTQAVDDVTNSANTALAAALPTTQALEEVAAEGVSDLTESAAVIVDDVQVDDVQVAENTYLTNDEIDPANLDSNTVQIAENQNIPGEITVKGTYYPKAVYNDADFSSSLLMRVSPGTQLQVSRAMGTWFEVETEKGVGYVHARDIQ